MRRRRFLAALGASAAWPIAAYAQGKLWRIGVLETIPPAQNAANFAALRKGLGELGWVEGRNLAIEYRSSNGNDALFDDFAAEMLRLKVDLIVTRGTPAVLAAKKATASIPVVMAAIGDPMMAVKSIARPGGNVTGLSAFVTQLQAKRVEVLKDIIPSVRRIANLANLGNPVLPPQWKEIEAAALTLRLEAQLFDVRSAADIDSAFDAAVMQHTDALIMGLDSVIQSNADRIVALAIRHRLPTIYASREFVEAGGLISYGVSYPDLYRRAAAYIDKIFKGTMPADLPIEQPTKFEFVVNMKTAKTLGLSIPQSIYLRIDEMIE